jgi:hypothetical protein
MNIYLDIDGVILANEKNLALGAEEFLKYVIPRYPTYWLTTHCMDGDPSLAIQNVGRLCTPEVRELLKLIKPTAWRVAKTEAIDFSEEFLWFDDDLYDDERGTLEKNNALSSWLEVNLSENQNQLVDILADFTRPSS